MLKEFRDFISRGNVMDLAVGIIIGAAFTAIVTSFVKDIVTPIISLPGKANFENMFLVLKEGDKPHSLPPSTPAEAQALGDVTLTYGAFLNAVLNFLLIAIVVFFIVKAVSKFRAKPGPAAPPAPTNEELLLTEIRDLLKTK